LAEAGAEERRGHEARGQDRRIEASVFDPRSTPDCERNCFDWREEATEGRLPGERLAPLLCADGGEYDAVAEGEMESEVDHRQRYRNHYNPGLGKLPAPADLSCGHHHHMA
jgi:hypothetical protein